MNLNGKQALAIISAVLSVLVVSTAQLTDLVGTELAKDIVSIAALANTILTSVLAAITSQSATVKDTMAMPGIEPLRVNEKANATLAAIAVDPKQDNIAPVPGKEAAVQAIATQ